jgi:hypothetical protein
VLLRLVTDEGAQGRCSSAGYRAVVKMAVYGELGLAKYVTVENVI